MGSQKGITMTSLIIYIISFTIVIGIVSTITTFFSKNINEDLPVAASSEYNKFNIYMLDETKKSGNLVKQPIENGVLEFSNGDKFTLANEILYFNKIKLCENVSQFYTETYVSDNGKTVLKITININDTTYSTDYVIE